MFSEDECPLCITPFTEQERSFNPCGCGYRVCVWCWNTICQSADESETGTARCPNCRRDFDVASVMKQRAAPQQRRPRRRAHASKVDISEDVVDDGRSVALRGVPGQHLRDADDLRTHTWLGQFGRTLAADAGAGRAVVRFASADDAAAAVAAINGPSGTFVYVAGDDGSLTRHRVRAALVPTRYCASYLRNEQCQRPRCVELHAPCKTGGSARAKLLRGRSAAMLDVFGSPHRFAPAAAAAAASPGTGSRAADGEDADGRRCFGAADAPSASAAAAAPPSRAAKPIDDPAALGEWCADMVTHLRATLPAGAAADARNFDALANALGAALAPPSRRLPLVVPIFRLR